MAGLFNAAIKSLSTASITSQYSLSPQPTSFSGPWKIHDGKKRSTNQLYSVFVFERSSLNPPSASNSLRSNQGVKAAQDEVIDRLKKEVGLLARLRHPNVLELVEPVEETRTGLVFVTEVVVGSLQSVLNDTAGASGDSDRRRRRRDVEIDELEIQKGLLQLGKALEFLHESAGLVHGNLTPEAIFVNAKSDWKIAGLGFASSHTNTPSVSTSPSPSPSPFPTDLVSLASQHDPRLPSSVQLNLDYSSPDLLLDSSITPALDLFSLGLFIIAIYNSPHESPLKAHNSPTNYRRLFNSSTTIPNQSNGFLCSKPVPQALQDDVLPRLITRRPATRINAREFQEAGYFDNILVSTIRFLDTFPAKSANEKNAFMRGLPKVLPQFPTSVAQRKVLPMLVEELKDKGELLPWTLAAVLTLVESLPTGSRVIGEKILPAFRATFDLVSKREKDKDTVVSAAPRPGTERDGREAALAVMLERLGTLRDKCTTNEFRDDIVPLYLLALDSTTSHLQGLALKSLGQILPKITFNAVKTDIFPVVSTVFTKTSSLGIKIACFEALRVLCGGPMSTDDGLTRDVKGDDGNSVSLDRFTVQEKVLPLIKGIKTREPAVMMAALELYTQIGSIVDINTLACEVLPALWTLALGPLLNIDQFKSFMTTIKHASNKIESEQLRKLAETSSTHTASAADFSTNNGSMRNGTSHTVSDDENFEELVFGKKSSDVPSNDPWSTAPVKPASSNPSAVKKDAPTFSWSTPPPPASNKLPPHSTRTQSTRAITPDVAMSSFGTLQPAKVGNAMNNTSGNFGFSQPLQPSRPTLQSANSAGAALGGLGMGMNSLSLSGSLQPQPSMGMATLQPSKPGSLTTQTLTPNTSGIDWSTSAMKPTTSTTLSSVAIGGNNGGWGITQQKTDAHPTILFGQTRQQAAPVQTEFSGFSIAPPPPAPQPLNGGGTAFGGHQRGTYGNGLGGGNGNQLQGRPMGTGMNMGLSMNSAPLQPLQPSKNQAKSGLDAFESLL